MGYDRATIVLRQGYDRAWIMGLFRVVHQICVIVCARHFFQVFFSNLFFVVANPVALVGFHVIIIFQGYDKIGLCRD